MTVTYQSVGAVGQGSTSAAPTFPATVNAGELYLLPVAWGNSTDTPPAAPSGWTQIGTSYIGGNGSYGVDTGNRGVTLFVKIADGTEDGATVTVTNGGSGGTCTTSGQIIRLTKSSTAWYVSVVGGTDTSNDTSFSVTAGSDPGSVNGDLAIVCVGWTPDTNSASSQTLTWTGSGAGAMTQIQQIANSNGNDQRYHLYRNALTGTSSAAPVFTATGSGNVAGAAMIVLIHDGAAPVIDVDDAAHAHSATSPTLTQNHVLAVDNATHAHSATEPTLTLGAPTVEPDDALHAHSATSPTLTQHQVLAVDDAAHAHAATEPTLTQHQVLDVDDAAHDHTATSPSLTQHHVLDVDDASHEHTATSPTLSTGTPTVEPDDASHAHAATEPTLVQHHVLTVDNASHGHVATSPTLSQHHVLTVDDALHAHSATEPNLVTQIPRNITVTATIAPARFAAALEPATCSAVVLDGTRTAVLVDGTRTATVAPARYIARIEAT